jgi:hypothetical protein
MFQALMKTKGGEERFAQHGAAFARWALIWRAAGSTLGQRIEERGGNAIILNHATYDRICSFKKMPCCCSLFKNISLLRQIIEHACGRDWYCNCGPLTYPPFLHYALWVVGPALVRHAVWVYPPRGVRLAQLGDVSCRNKINGKTWNLKCKAMIKPSSFTYFNIEPNINFNISQKVLQCKNEMYIL